MAEVRVSDPSRLHLKKELTQIRRAAKVLRDPGTTSTWKSPLSTTSRSAAAPAAMAPPHPASNAKEKKVILYNWTRNNKSRNGDGLDDDDLDSSSCAQSVDDNLSDTRNADSRSDSYSMILRCRDASQVTLGTPTMRRGGGSGGKKKGRKSNVHLDSMMTSTSYKQLRDVSLARKLIDSREDNPLLGLGIGRDGSVEHSDDTEDYSYSNSEDFRKNFGASPLLLKLKNKNWSRPQSKFFTTSRRGDSSCTHSTPALSTSSFNRYANRNPSTVESWDATTASMNDGDDEIDDKLDLPGRQGCGIPCYWSKRTLKLRGECRSCYSPSLSDTIRRNVLCGNRTMYKRHRRSSSIPSKRRIASRSAQGVLPLLANSGYGGGGSSVGTGHSDDELSTNFGELELEALSRLDGRRWSTSCRSEEGLEIVPVNGENDEESTPENIKSLSQKYRPMFFDDLIGQNIVVQSLVNAIARGRIAPVYLFQGPRGTGKTSTARIFTAALNCEATETMRPCGYCRECAGFVSGKSRNLWEVDSTNKKQIDRVRYLLKNITVAPPSVLTGYKVFVIDECHLLSSKTWLGFLKFLEETPPQVVFIFFTTDVDNVPRTIQSRCQKYVFNKIKDGDIVARLKKIAIEENLDVELDALDLIALNADGSLRDAETMLDQLSLLGKRITTSLVNELVGVVSDEKLLELLELAMSSNTAETVKRARELMDSGVCPTVLMSQLASLIMDIIAGTYNTVDAKDSNLLFGGRNLTESEVERLKHALKLLSETEKQIRLSSEGSTWFTATLLQLGSVPSSNCSRSSSRRQSSKQMEEDPSSVSRENPSNRQKSGALYTAPKSTSGSVHKVINGNSSHHEGSFSHIGGYVFNSNESRSGYNDGGTSSSSREDDMVARMIRAYKNADKFDDIWACCIEKCHSKTLQQLLCRHGKLLSISENEGVLVAYVAFADGNIKLRAERFLSSITNSIEIVLKRTVEVRILHLPDVGVMNASNLNELPGLRQMENEREMMACSDLDSQVDPRKGSRGSFTDLEDKAENYSNCSPMAGATRAELLAEGCVETNLTGERGQKIPAQRIESIIREQRLETAWLQTVEKGTPGSLGCLRPEKNQVLPQEGIYQHGQIESTNSSGVSSQQWEDELNHELKILKINDAKALQKDETNKRGDLIAMSPSLLHERASHHGKDHLGYESGPTAGGCSSLFCWKNTRTWKREKAKGNVCSRRSARFSLFGECAKTKKAGAKSRRKTGIH